MCHMPHRCVDIANKGIFSVWCDVMWCKSSCDKATSPLSFFACFPVRTHQALNSNMCCCSALICSYMLYANRGCHHSVLPGSVSRVGLMVRCFKNSLSVRTENKWNARLHNLLTILWASRKLPAVFYELTIERMFLWEPAEPSLYTSLFIFNSSYMYNTCSTIVCPSFHVT